MRVELHLASAGGKGARESAATLAAVMRAVEAGRVDPTTTRVSCEWIQYRRNFREPVMARPLLGTPRARRELAFDLRRTDPESLDAEISAVLAPRRSGEEQLVLENFVPQSKSAIWRFNALFWSELALWEQVSEHSYIQSIPGGQSGGTNTDAARALIKELFRIFDGLTRRHALPDQLTVLELGVGDGQQARAWLDEFARLDAERGGGYYRRLVYLMGDYSTRVLDTARAAVAEHRAHVSTIVLDAARPREALRFLEGKVFLVYISNVYDNLPTDEIARVDDVLYQVETRAVLAPEPAAAVIEEFALDRGVLADTVRRLGRLGPVLLAESDPEFADAARATRFWQAIWSALRLEERYVPLGPLDGYEICEGLSGELLGPMTDGHGDIRMHVSNGAVASFVDTLPLLHPLGLLTCHDLFATDLDDYRSGFRGPGKYDGSVVNWVNGPMLRACASRLGFQINFAPFAFGSRSPLTTATARARD